MLTIMGALAEFERNLIKERQREGVAIAEAAGKFKGRPNTISDSRRTKLYSSRLWVFL